MRPPAAVLLALPAPTAAVSGLHLVSPRGGAGAPAEIAWDADPAAAFYVVEEQQQGGGWGTALAVGNATTEAALWRPACTVRVGAVGADLLAAPARFSASVDTCAPPPPPAPGAAPAAGCATLGNPRAVGAGTTDTEAQLAWDVAPGGEPAQYVIEARKGLSWEEVATAPAASLPGRDDGCRGQAARVSGLSPGQSLQLRVSATVAGTQRHSAAVAVRTRKLRCAVSLVGEPFFPSVSAEDQAAFGAERIAAQARYDVDRSELNLVWLARVDGFLYDWGRALSELADADKAFPDSFRVPRHIGHRHIGLRDAPGAQGYMGAARARVQGVPATAEFFPAELRIVPAVPKSSSQFNIYYHLGLSHFIAGNYSTAAAVYEEGFRWAFTEYDEGDDAFIAMNYWLVNTYQRIGTPAALRKCAELLANVSSTQSSYNVVEKLGWGYWYGLRLYKGDITPAEVLAIAATLPSLALDTYGYAVAQYLYTQPGAEAQRQSRQLMAIIRSDPMWASFGYVGAEYDLFRPTE